MKKRDKYPSAAWFRYTQYICPLSTCVPSFNLLGLTIPEKSVRKFFNVWKLEKRKNEKISGQIRAAAWFWYTRYILPFSTCNKCQPSRPHSSWEKCDEKFSCLKIGEKEKWKIKGQIRAAAWLQYTRHISPLSMCVPSFNLLGLTGHEKSVTKTFNVWKLERKKNEEIKGWICRSSLILG